MAEDDLQDLINARAALAKKRLTLAQTITTSGDDGAIKAVIEVQQAIAAVDIAIEELTEELEEAEDDEEE